MAGFLSKLLTFGEGKQLKNYQALADKIGGLEPEMQAKSDEQLRAFTDELRGRVQAGASTADVLPEAFAAVREASVRTLGMRHFDVQLIGGMALNGEGYSFMELQKSKVGRWGAVSWQTSYKAVISWYHGITALPVIQDSMDNLPGYIRDYLRSIYTL